MIFRYLRFCFSEERSSCRFFSSVFNHSRFFVWLVISQRSETLITILITQFALFETVHAPLNLLSLNPVKCRDFHFFLDLQGRVLHNGIWLAAPLGTHLGQGNNIKGQISIYEEDGTVWHCQGQGYILYCDFIYISYFTFRLQCSVERCVKESCHLPKWVERTSRKRKMSRKLIIKSKCQRR